MSHHARVPEYSRIEFRPKNGRYACVVPVLNEGERIQRQLRKMSQDNQSVDCFVVDGGSDDGALDESLMRQTGVRLLLKTGRGLSSQMRVGLSVALADGYEGVIMIDGNDKDDPEGIARFAAELDRGFDHVQGSRFISGGIDVNTPWTRRVLIRWVHAPLVSLGGGFRYTDSTNGFRAYSRRLLTDSRVQPFRDVFARYELHYYLAIRAARLGFKVREIPVTRRYPVNAPVPTKISGLRGHWKIWTTLMNAVLHRYDPRDAR